MSVPQPPSQPNDRNSSATTDINPIFALKELVARLHREQHKIQDLLSSLGFALRSFNNLNQFLDLITLMATRGTEANGSALILFKPNGQVRLERLHCQDNGQAKTIRKALETATSTVTESFTKPLLVPAIAALDNQVSNYLGPDVQLLAQQLTLEK